MRLEVVVAAADTPDAVVDDRDADLSELLADPGVDPARKRELLCALRHVRAVDCTDLLLHSLTGRYVWIYAGAYPAGECDWTLRGLRLEFPRVSFTGYFPEIYRQDDFFDRYIAVFQSLYLDLERRADELPHRLDYETVPDEGLLELADWLGLCCDGLFTPAQLRTIISGLDLYQGMKGTRAALEAVLESYGVPPRIVERFQWERIPPLARALYGRLYGGDSGSFCAAASLPGFPEPGRLERLIRLYSPIGTLHRLVFLNPCSRADDHVIWTGPACWPRPVRRPRTPGRWMDLSRWADEWKAGGLGCPK
ncbi:MAG: phage tail protein [Anaerotruncus massiliensis (ex Togo et al. 2019)]